MVHSVAEIKNRFSYSPVTGIIKRKKSLRGKEVTKKIGFYDHGYIRIKIKGRPYAAHRLAWVLHYGRWPSSQIDHINGNRSDNRIKNLRECDGSLNLHNSKNFKNNTSGYRGVVWDNHYFKWRSQIIVNGKRVIIGRFTNKRAAGSAYKNFKKQLFSGVKIRGLT